MNLNDEEDDQKRCRNGKGKEICRNDDDKFVPDHEEEMICSSFGHSKELNFVDDSMQWGQDWWWRQDGSGELCSKDYVKEWIGSQICPSTNPDWEDEEDEKGEKSTQQLGKSGGGGSSSKPESKKRPSGEKSMNKKQRKMQEWWKEENLAEVSNNGHSTSKLKKIECRLKKGLRIQSARSFLFRKKKRIKFSQNESNPDRDFSFRRKKHSHHSGAASDMWSGDVYSRELSSTTSMRGTVCYVAPEYGGGGGGGGGGYLMEKADIYSLGVLILVIVSGRRPLHVLNSPMKLEKANLIHWCRLLAKGGGNVLELVDEKLKGAYNKEQASLCINLALMCLKKMPELRPDIGEIVKILKGEMDLQGVPFEFSPSPPSRYFSRSRRRAKTDVE
ncbi:hypothetical protein MKW94_008217 [Papaver nudicaule]|uniref:Protein kinase domain-containing protein n=1 Tax=Papaver nudicaule TaxID=74823 RepID=A0AA41RYL6_PAPNU|nr:hypothetical protein [Papaver nudicaule]